MVTGYSTQVQYFDDFLVKKYSSLKVDAQRICWNDSNYEDLLGENIFKVRERIAKSGFTGNNFYGYVWRGMSNQNKLQKKRSSRVSFIDFSDPAIQNQIQDWFEDQNHNS
jgi:hypothetical protein